MTGDITALRLQPPAGIEILDQTALPHAEIYLALHTLDTVCEAIRTLRVRGAPLLGLTGACGMAIAAGELGAETRTIEDSAAALVATRPTAVDLGAAVRAALILALSLPEADRRAALWANASAMAAARVNEDWALGRHGATLIPPGAAVLTHCNTGALATGGTGTALGVIRTAWENGSLAHCYATETRPLWQGARLTMWELKRLGIPGTLLADTAAGALLASGRIQAVITGADRIAANGDSANKIGTYMLAVLAARHNIPFYIAAPMTTVDLDCPGGGDIPIEFRDPEEVGGYAGTAGRPRAWRPTTRPSMSRPPSSSPPSSPNAESCARPTASGRECGRSAALPREPRSAGIVAGREKLRRYPKYIAPRCEPFGSVSTLITATVFAASAASIAGLISAGFSTRRAKPPTISAIFS